MVWPEPQWLPCFNYLYRSCAPPPPLNNWLLYIWYVVLGLFEHVLRGSLRQYLPSGHVAALPEQYTLLNILIICMIYSDCTVKSMLKCA